MKLTNEQHDLVMELIQLTEARTRLNIQITQGLLPHSVEDAIEVKLEEYDELTRTIWRELNA